MKATFERNEGSFSKQAFKTTRGTCVYFSSNAVKTFFWSGMIQFFDIRISKSTILSFQLGKRFSYL